MAVVLKANPVHPQKRHIEHVVDSLRNAGMIVYPTDTTYGLGADLFSKKGIDRIYRIKPQKKKKPLSFICADLKDISRYAHVSDSAYRIMKRLLPGPYTFVLPATREVPRLVMTKRKTVGIRVPDNNICLEIVRALGNPVISTSATSDQKYFDDPDIIEDKLGHAVDYILDGGIIPFEPSTVIDFTDGDEPVLLREGKGDLSSIY